MDSPLVALEVRERSTEHRTSILPVLQGTLEWVSNPPPKLKGHVTSDEWYLSLLQRPQVGAFLHDAFRGLGLGVREKVRKGSGEEGECYVCGWLGWERLCADVESIGQVELLLLFTSLWHWIRLIGLSGAVA